MQWQASFDITEQLCLFDIPGSVSSCSKDYKSLGQCLVGIHLHCIHEHCVSGHCVWSVDEQPLPQSFCRDVSPASTVSMKDYDRH